ncbi:fumarate reductase flavoprotein subunit [Lactobacillus colini]|uniref:Urocanate reductase n=1 Tax=Lactobacillus colini TaxID=1819254 RepID=A0ABS4MBZ7_9LACO|nr:FAD-dependent oxidoreductase [Lactobacillus colini]MBP2057207.1 fumarate reductase flavoprotein subunit [Lactobacillus colini]
MQNGTYSATIQGFHGPITAHVKVNDNNIEDVKLKGLTPFTVGETAAKIMAKKIVEYNSVDIDAITSASYSSNAVRLAVKKALKLANGEIDQARADDYKADKFEQPRIPKYAPVSSKHYYESQVTYTDQYDMIIAGSGVSGLAAAIVGAEHGLRVHIFEKAGMAGGTSKYSEGEVQAAGTEPQRKFSKFKDDNVETHIEELLLAGGSDVDINLVKSYAQDAPKIIEWLSDLGIKWTSVFGHKGLPYEDRSLQADRIHIYEHGGVGGGGIVLTNLLLKTALDKGVTISYDSPVIGLINKSTVDNRVTGVVIKNSKTTEYYKAKKGVLLATSGIDHNISLSKALSPENYRDLMNHKVNTSRVNTGDGIMLGMNLGAAITGFGGVVDSNSHIPEARNSHPTVPAIFVNGFGNRYVNEEMTYGYITRQNFLQQEATKKDNWAIFNENILGIPGTWKDKSALQSYIKQGFIKKADTVKELAEKIGVSAVNLKHTITVWNKVVDKGEDCEFGRRLALKKLSAPYYAYQMVDGNYGTIGGLKVDVDQHVLDNLGKIIPDLYAAGMNAGGTIGKVYFASGLALGTGLHQGRQAAKSIAEGSDMTRSAEEVSHNASDTTSSASQY